MKNYGLRESNRSWYSISKANTKMLIANTISKWPSLSSDLNGQRQ